MAVYDENQTHGEGESALDDGESKSLAPVELAEREANPETGSDGNTPPDDSLESRFGNMVNDAREKDNFYKGGDSKKKSGGKSLFKRKGVIAGIGGGGIFVVIMSALLFNFLHTFQMDHFFKNTENKTGKRLTASLDTRNKRLVKAYMAMRLTEYEGNTEGKNLFFKADKVTSRSNPMQNWYATLRKNKFEEQVFGKEGIAFVSMVDADGKIMPARIKALEEIHPDLTAKYLTNKENGGYISAENITQKLSAIPDDDLEKIVTVDKFDTHKAARVSVKEAVNREVPWYRTFKRRQMRKDIQSVAGIKSWRLFEKTRDKVAKKKQDIENQLYAKIIDRFYGRNPNTANLLKCIFANGSCAKSDDTADPGNQSELTNGDSLPTEAPSDPNASEATKAGDATQKAGESDIASSVKSGTQDVLDTAAEGDINKGLKDETVQALKDTSFSKRIVYSVISKATGQELSEVVETAIPVPSPTKIWTIAKWVKKVDNLLGKGGNSKLSMMVKNAKRAQLIGLFATYSMGNDQMKSGQLVGDQLNAYFKSTQNLGNSEGWCQMNNETSNCGGSENNPQKDAYCKKDPSQRSFTEYAYYCDEQKPNNGGNAEKLSEMYKGSVGVVAEPIANAVDKIEHLPGFQAVAEFIPNLVSKVTEPLTNAFLNSGLGKNIYAWMGGLMTKLVDLLGGGPIFDGQSPGVANLLIAGGAAQSESSTRESGGMAATKTSLDFTNQLAAQYDKEQVSNQSIFDRYASVDNPNSFASNALFAVTTKPLTQQVSSFFTSISHIPVMFGNMLSGRAFAQTSQPSSDISDWAGVDKFDIPQQCQDLDPLDPNYLSLSSNISRIGLDPNQLGWDTMRDSAKFWQKVYETKAVKDNPDAAKPIYNCALFDARAMGSIGAVYGYSDDGGYDPTKPSGSSDRGGSTADGGLGTAASGFTFPLQTTKSAITSHNPAWCYSSQENCHHHYNAADIFADTGTTVVAAKAGTIVIGRNNPTGGSGSVVVIKGDDGIVYSYLHMKSGSVPFSGGEHVNAGDKIGEVGTNADAQGTSSHLHFDIQPPPATTRQACADAACAQPPFNFLNPQPALIEAYNYLPG